MEILLGCAVFVEVVLGMFFAHRSSQPTSKIWQRY